MIRRVCLGVAGSCAVLNAWRLIENHRSSAPNRVKITAAYQSYLDAIEQAPKVKKADGSFGSDFRKLIDRVTHFARLRKHANRLFRLLDWWRVDLYQVHLKTEAETQRFKVQIPDGLELFLDAEARGRYLQLDIKEQAENSSRTIEFWRSGYWNVLLIVPRVFLCDKTPSIILCYENHLDGTASRVEMEMCMSPQSWKERTQMDHHDYRTDWFLDQVRDEIWGAYPSHYFLEPECKLAKELPGDGELLIVPRTNRMPDGARIYEMATWILNSSY